MSAHSIIRRFPGVKRRAHRSKANVFSKNEFMASNMTRLSKAQPFSSTWMLFPRNAPFIARWHSADCWYFARRGSWTPLLRGGVRRPLFSFSCHSVRSCLGHPMNHMLGQAWNRGKGQQNGVECEILVSCVVTGRVEFFSWSHPQWPFSGGDFRKVTSGVFRMRQQLANDCLALSSAAAQNQQEQVDQGNETAADPES